MQLKNVPAIENRKDVQDYLGALGVHALEIAHARLTQDEMSSTKLLLDFADLTTKLADLHPKNNSAVLAAGAGATINFHFSKPPPGQAENVITIEATPEPLPESVLPPTTPTLQAEALLLNADLG